MWSHIIVPLATLTTKLHLYWLNLATWAQAGTIPHTNDYISPAGDFSSGAAPINGWWYADLTGSGGQIPTCGNGFQDAGGAFWVYGLLIWWYDTISGTRNTEYWAGRWNAATAQVDRVWAVSSPPEDPGPSFTATYGGILSACDDGAGGLYAAVYSPTQKFSGLAVAANVVVRWSSGTSAASVQGTATVSRWQRYGDVDPGDPYAGISLLALPDFAFATATYWSNGRVQALFRHSDGIVYGLMTGTVIFDDPVLGPIPAAALGLAKAAGGDAHDADSWTELIGVMSRYDLTTPNSTAYLYAFGPVRRRTLWPQAHDSDTYFAWGFARDTTSGHTAADQGVVWCFTAGGVLTPSFTLPAAAYGSTCHWGGPLTEEGGTLYLATVEGWSAGDTGSSPAALRIWALTSAPSTWTEVGTWTGTRADLDGNVISGFIGDGTGTLHLLLSLYSVDLSSVDPVREFLFDTATATWTQIAHGTPSDPGGYFLQSTRRYIKEIS